MGSRFLFASVAFIFLTFTLICCKNPSRVEPIKIVEEDSASTFPEAFIRRKLEQGADTIVFSRRVQMNCCEFCNVFWTKGGKHHLNNFYWQVTDSNAYGYTRTMFTKEIDLGNDSIFTTLEQCYGRLKVDSIITVFNSISHYSFTDLTIYTKIDSLDVRIHDHDFNKPSVTNGLKGKELQQAMKEATYTYRSNTKSAWNKLQLAIEKEIFTSPQISIEEKEHLRVYFDKIVVDQMIEKVH